MADNQITPFQLTDQFTMDNFNQRINETNTALQKKAEGGYGFGGDAQQLAFASDEDFMNWVSSLGSKTLRNFYSASVHLTYLHNYRMQMLIVSSQTADMQELSILALTYDGYLLTRYRDYYENWKPWEWVRPPMLLGVEYRTTERYLGKPVYVKAVDFGALPSASRKSVAHGASNVEKIISAYGFETNGTAVFNIPQYASAGDFVFCFAGKELIYVDTGGNMSGWSANVIIKYTKTTD